MGGDGDLRRGAWLREGCRGMRGVGGSAANGSLSRIVTALKPGAGVVTTRGHVHWVVTEYGAVNLHGKTFKERADLLIGIAHPDFRAELRRSAARG